MIQPATRLFLSVALFFVLVPGLLLFTQRPGTASFVITVFTLIIGVVFTLVVLATHYLSGRSGRSDD